MSERDKQMTCLLQDFSDSNLTVARFCAQRQVSVATFYYWKKKLGPVEHSSREVSPAAPLSGFLALAPRPVVDPATMRVRLPGGLEVELRGGSPAQLSELLHTLDARYRA